MRSGRETTLPTKLPRHRTGDDSGSRSEWRGGAAGVFCGGDEGDGDDSAPSSSSSSSSSESSATWERSIEAGW